MPSVLIPPKDWQTGHMILTEYYWVLFSLVQDENLSLRWITEDWISGRMYWPCNLQMHRQNIYQNGQIKVVQFMCLSNNLAINKASHYHQETHAFIQRYKKKLSWFFPVSAPRPIQSISRDVHLCVCPLGQNPEQRGLQTSGQRSFC